MLHIYLKQTWETIRQNRLFSFIYVVGTGLSIALTMTLFIIFYVKTAPIYPEYNRNRTVVLQYLKCYPSDKPENWHASGLSLEAATLLDSLPHLEDMAMTGDFSFSWEKVALPGQAQAFSVNPLYVSPGFWRVFTLHFVSGQPFTEEDDNARARKAVISKSLSRKLFATVDGAGEVFLYKGRPFTVCGVVEDVSSATPNAVADIWLPLMLSESDAANHDEAFPLLGDLTFYLTASTPAATESLKEEVRDAFRRYTAGRDYGCDLMGQPDDASLASFRTSSVMPPDLGGVFRSLLYIVLALLFIPAINLSGMIASRMDRRTAEMGIRKAYGATRRTLLGQVMWENLLLTLMGAVSGLVFCYVIVLTSGSWVLTLFDSVNLYQSAPFLTMEMLFNPWVFLCALGLCLVLNVVSALVPAWWGLKHTIVQELYMKR